MQSNDEIKSKVIKGLFWKFLERFGTQAVHFVITILLARILMPKDYGVIALISVFIAIANVFVSSGFNTALIQKRDADELDFSSVFYFSLIVALFIYVVLFFVSPLIAGFYKEPLLVQVIRVLAITLFFGAVNSIQNAVVSKRMEFKRYFYSSSAGIIASGAAGIVLAYMGFGVWALVFSQLVNSFSVTLVLWFTVRWRPKLMFSFKRLKSLFSFGYKLLLSSLIDTIFNNIYPLIIGRIYSKETLGYYNKGDQFPNLIVTNINGSISSVMLPALSEQQKDKERLKSMVRRSIVTSSFILFPVLFGLAATAEPVVKILLTDKWLPCVPYMQILCVSYAFWPIHIANLQAINAVGRSDIYLILEILKKAITVISLCVSIPFGVMVMVALKPVTSIIGTFINAYPNKKLLGYSIREQWADIAPYFLSAIFMSIAVYSIRFLKLSVWPMMIIQVAAGIVIYFSIAFLFKFECLQYLLVTIKGALGRRSKKVKN